MRETIALCIPAYNAAWCLPRLLNSAKNQKIPFDEILVYNDCSLDNTSEIAIAYGAKVINGQHNMGCSFGKNKLAEIAISNWIHFHDADDELLPNFMQIATEWINSDEKLDIILLNYEYRDFESGKTLGYANYCREALLKDKTKFVLTNKIVNFALINRKSFLTIGGFNTHPNVLYNEDRAFYSKAVVSDLSFDYEEAVTCINFRYNESMSVSNMLKCSYAHYHVSFYLFERLKGKYNEELAKIFLDDAKIAASFQDWKLTKMNIKYAVKLNAKVSDTESNIFRNLFSINPFLAFWLREKMIRLFKPQHRKDG